MRRACFSLLALLLTAALALPASAAVLTNFDTGLDGWTVTGDNASVWSAAGGNPGACLSVNDLATGDNNLSVAPAPYLGDWSAMGAGDSLSVDVRLVKISGTDVPLPWLFRIEGPGGAAHALVGTFPPFGVWTRYSVSLSSAQWVLESGSWPALLANVTSLLIASEYINGTEDVWLDNVLLTRSPQTQFNPCVLETFNTAGLGAWSFSSTGGASNPGSGGNTAGFCQITDGTGIGFAFAPPVFHGDWSPLDGTGRMQLDVRRLTAAGAPLADLDLVTLSGPGGSAKVTIAAADLPAVPRLWKRFVFPIRESAWTLTSGTWAGLLANVTSMRIRGEFMDNSDNVGIDNVARLSADCPDPDVRVNVLGVGPWLCGVTSMVSVQSVAYDAVSATLYGIVDSASASGGGLWTVTGATPGVRLQAYTTPTHALFDGAGNAYVTEATSGNVNRRTPAGTTSIWVAGFHASDDDPAGMCFAPPGFDGPNVSAGDVIVTDYGFSGPDEIWAFSTLAAEGERQLMTDPGEVDIYDVTAGPAGRVWFADALDPDSLFSVGPTGQMAGIRLTSPIPGIQSVVWDPLPGTGWLYVASRGTGALWRVNHTNGAVEQVATGFMTLDQCALEIDVPGRRLWVADPGANRIYEFCLPNSFTDAAPGPLAPRALALSAGPNPFTHATSLAFSLPAAADVRVVVYDLGGRQVRTLARERFAAGRHQLGWDGRDDRGVGVSPGVYRARVESGGASAGVALVRVR
ncbi:MAG: hypothetical protein IT348_06240 [Candidatus Eisenbacteria bacterium]|nr:hypothetical protein [Candidatus Eisenbacteria bacterium]